MLTFTLPQQLSTLFLPLILLASVAQAKVIEEEFDAQYGDTLHLKTDQGNIQVKTHNDESVEFYIEIDGEDEEEFTVNFDKHNNGIKVRGERQNKHSWSRTRISYLITVPKNYNLDLNTAGGKIEIVDDLTGDIDARTSGGAIKVADVKGDVQLHTSGGSIKTEDIEGEIDAHTSGGSINVVFAKQIAKDAILNTSGGSIVAALPADIRMDLDASTSGGIVKSEFDIDGRVKKRSIDGQINGGGPQLKLHTSGGSIRIVKR
ncbi:DUF4097 family beta strand repeat-containing protein [Alteromonas sp. ASW11-130]|uniref:DUF4097 family beta strand repeat-containing protein n=1 Tax=Alteromonas sp. ASW11-130 TaxID=3015775 RepID=UPI0022419B54|nr:DUF4097 family beta strand repeat-containing protein [Alteromonas sp. ASW11-130]MCW8093424.1 DUF4097 domain-containing protein [Alteromonas sp. ASW11-130]